MNPQVKTFHDPVTSTFTHVVYDSVGGHAAIVDPVLDYDAASARTSTTSADEVLAFVRAQSLTVEWILETHAHADHLTAASYLKHETGARVAIGKGITGVQARFKTLFGLGADFEANGSQFDRLLSEGEQIQVGALTVDVIATPGHTDDSLTYVIGDAAFVGDTVFGPAAGTARADFPGGDASTLYQSIQRLLGLPENTRLFLCHDYPQAGEAPRAESSPSEQRSKNIHIGGGTDQSTFVALRNTRDATLPSPRLILPALQVNIRAGELPQPDANGIRYLRLPVNQIGSKQ